MGHEQDEQTLHRYHTEVIVLTTTTLAPSFCSYYLFLIIIVIINNNAQQAESLYTKWLIAHVLPFSPREQKTQASPNTQ